jgi:hypothetical protein
MEETVVLEFHRKMTQERVTGAYTYETDLKKNYREILLAMADGYSEYRRLVPKFLSSLENNHGHSESYSIKLFFQLYGELTKSDKFKFFDLAVMDHHADEQIFEKMHPIMEASYSKHNQQRISEENFDLDSLTEKDKKEISALIIRKLQSDAKILNWNKDMVDVTLMEFTLLRQILTSINSAELFYHAVGLLIDRLTSSEFYQAGRDIAEEIIISSYKDQVPELGYFNSFRLYSNTGSIHASLLYANLSMICILQKQPPYSEKYVKEIVWQGMKLFRNIRLFPLAAQIYNEVPMGLSFIDYEKRSLDHTYFTCLLSMMDPSLPSLLLDYLNKEREEVISGGINEALPWLLTLYNIRRLYPKADFSSSGLGFFLNIFEMIVPGDTIKKYKDIILGDTSDLKKHLKESLVKLNETRNRTDFVYDNESAIKISSRLIPYSTENKDASAFLMSMTLKSDYSILFQPKESKELAPLILPEVNIDALEILYDDHPRFLEAVPIESNTSLNWLAYSEGKLFQLELFNKQYSFSNLTEWDYDAYNALINSDYFADLKFNYTVNDNQNVRLVSPEEFEEEENIVATKLKIAKLSVTANAKAVHIVKDMELSKFPHNLFLNKNGEFIAKKIPVTNVLSTEWLIQTKNSQLPSDYSKAVWIPVESGDIPLNYLHSNIDETLQKKAFEIFTKVQLANPLSSDINIVCSHGAKNISETQILFQENNPTHNLNAVIGKGKVLIFFVCYSGSMKTEFYRNNVASLIKRFISQGYEAVIAPYWALEVTIPRYWLPEFLISLDAGETISQATFNANRKVYEQYPTPAAWACLHLYGNPNLRIERKP